MATISSSSTLSHAFILLPHKEIALQALRLLTLCYWPSAISFWNAAGIALVQHSSSCSSIDSSDFLNAQEHAWISVLHQVKLAGKQQGTAVLPVCKALI